MPQTGNNHNPLTVSSGGDEFLGCMSYLLQIMIELIMKKKPLIETNPYLRDPELRKYLIERNVASSCAIEGVRVKYPKFTKKLQKKMREAAQEAQNKNR